MNLMIKGAVVGAALVATLMTNSAIAQDKPFDGTELTYWANLVFSDEANAAIEEAVGDWATENGVDVELVFVNGGDLNIKLGAAVSSGALPDLVDISTEWLPIYAAQDVFLSLNDTFAEIGEANGGWLGAAQTVGNTGTEDDPKITGIPFGVFANMLIYRTDVLEAAGITAPPATWNEFVDQAKQVKGTPGVSPLALALSNVGDANTQVAVMQSFGGRVADDDGKTVTIASDETRAYLEWIKDAWDADLFAPGVTTYDGGGDNQAFLSGQAVFVANIGSIGQAARRDDPELFADTGFAALPGGPKGTVGPVFTNLRSIPAASDNADAAKSLAAYLLRPDVMSTYYENSIYGPVLGAQTQMKAFDGSDPILAGLVEAARVGTPAAYPDVDNLAFTEVNSNFLIPKMVQRVVVDGWSIDDAMNEAQEQAQAIYDKHN